MTRIIIASAILLSSLSGNAAELPAPATACSTMSEMRMPPLSPWKDYGYGMGFGCNSSYLEIGSARTGLANNIAYYVDGDASRVSQVKLVLNVNQPAQEREAKGELLKTGQRLSEKVVGEALPEDIALALSSGSAASSSTESWRHEVKRSDWPTGKGYEIHLIIRPAP